MSVLQVYLSWANSVLSGSSLPCSGVSAVQEGRVICRLIDTLCPDLGLESKVQESGQTNAQGYLRVALDHMRSHGIKFHFTPQDWKKWLKNILDGDIKSILDVLWLIILNYAVHSIGSSPYQRSVGIGKKLLLDWCQRELGVEFDPQSSLAYNLCTGDWFLKLLAKNSDRPLNDAIEREQNLNVQLSAIEKKYGIKQNLINPSDVTEGTIDEHTLMIYISLLRLKIGDSVDDLKSPRDLSFTSGERRLSDTSDTKSQSIPSIVFSQVSEGKTDSLEGERPVQGSPLTSAVSSPTQSPPLKRSPEVTDPDTSDWMSQSSGSPISSLYEKYLDQKSPDLSPEAEHLIKETISKQVEEHLTPREGMQGQDSAGGSHGSRIPVRVKPGDDSQQRSMSSPARVEGDREGAVSSRKISIKVQRPRSPNSIMAEARARQDLERERRKREKEAEDSRRLPHDAEEPVMTGSASEGGDVSAGEARLVRELEIEPVKSDEDDVVKPKTSSVTVNMANSTQINGELHNGVPVFVMPGKTHDMELLLEALHQARTEASKQDHLIQSAQPDNVEFKQVVDKNIEQLEAQLAAVKAQSKELFEDRARQQQEANAGRGRTLQREPAARNGCHSPPRGILDMMVNQSIPTMEETTPKQLDTDTHMPQGILKHTSRSPSEQFRSRSPTEHLRKFNDEVTRIRESSRSPHRSRSPHLHGTSDGEDDADKRLIKFLTNEIENMKLKMAVIEQKNNQRALSPHSTGPRVSPGLPDRERDRSPAQISSRARARFTTEGNLGSYSPQRGNYSPARGQRSGDLFEEIRSRSPRFGSSRSMSRSPARSPSNTYRSRSPDAMARERTRSKSPSARVLNVQDLSTSINDDIDGNLTFSPASGAKPVNLGYSSPIRKVNDEIWGYGQTEDEYYADTAKYETWKQLISRDASTDEDNLELKQALASALVELNIVQAKLKNANSDIKNKMAKTTEVLNDVRAQISKSQAENAELRSQVEREKSKGETQEMRIKEMEQNLHSAKTTRDDKTLELEESVLTLKGIVNLDKNQMSQLEEENDKLRRRISEFQRDNIKLREDFNELKIYNDKAQQTIRDLKQCLEDARTERSQLVAEIKRLKEQGANQKISSIVNHYMEKGLYEDAEKDHLADRARSKSPTPRYVSRPRSPSPVYSRPTTPVQPPHRAPSPVRFFDPDYTLPAYTPVSRSQSPAPSSLKYEDADLTSDGHEIYPHRRTRSYVEKFGSQNDLNSSQVDLNDPEIQELMKPRMKLAYDFEGDNQMLDEDDPKAKRKLVYSPYMDKDFVPSKHQNDIYESKRGVVSENNSSHMYGSPGLSHGQQQGDWDSNNFIKALDSAVKQSPAQIAQQRFQTELDRMSTQDISQERWRSPAKGILKNTKMAQNMSIKESITPTRRSMDSRSYSPSVRASTPNKPAARSFTPDSQRYTSPLTRSYSMNTGSSRSPSPRYRSNSPGYRSNGVRDSGYSTPTQNNSRIRSTDSNREYGRAHTPSSARQHEGKKGLLSEEERRYADLLIDKYTRQHIPPSRHITLASS